jgi:hypothetical protein
MGGQNALPSPCAWADGYDHFHIYREYAGDAHAHLAQ